MKKTFIVMIMSIVFSAYTISKEQSRAINIDQLQRFSLAEQMSMASGYDIRMRKIVVENGAKIAKHGHKDRAGLVYIISGEIIEYRNGKTTILKSGDSIIEDFNTVHAYENKSGKDCVLIAFDIPKSESEKHLEKFIKE